MIRLLITMSLLVIAGAMSAQRSYGSYESAISITPLSVEIASDSLRNYTLYVECWSDELAISDVNLEISPSAHKDFIMAMTYCRQKYLEWSKIAIQNDIKDFSKKFSKARFSCKGAFRHADDWHFDNRVDVDFYFRVINGVPMLAIQPSVMTSTSNQFVQVQNAKIVLLSQKQIEELMMLVSPAEIEKNVNEYAEKLRLFKE